MAVSYTHLDVYKRQVLNCANALNLQDIVRIDTTLGQLITGLNHLLVLNLNSGTVRNQIGLGVAGFCIGNNNLTLLLCIFNIYHAAELGNNSKSLRLTGLKKLLDTRKTLCNIATGNTAQMCIRDRI